MKLKSILFLIIPLLLSACAAPTTSLGPQPTATFEFPTPITSTATFPPIPTRTATPSITPTVPTATRTILPSSTPTPGPTLALGSTYTDRFAGYSLRYPSSWRVIDAVENQKPNSYVYAVSFRSQMVTLPSKESGIPPGASALDVNVFSFKAKTLAEAQAEFQALIARNEPPETIAGQEPWQLDSGIKAMRIWITSGTDRVPALLAVVKGKTLVITGSGDETIFNAIARTLK